MTAEERATGAVDARVYMEYIRAAGSWRSMAAIAALFLTFNVTSQLQSW